jgi:hypothetical protein
MPVPAPHAVKKALGPIVAKLLTAQAVHQALAEEMEKVDNDLLALADYVSQYDGTPITKAKDAWLMSDEQAVTFFAARNAYIAANHTVPEVGFCPALMAESQVRDLKKELIEAATQFFPELTFDAVCMDMKTYHKAVELLTGLTLAA